MLKKMVLLIAVMMTLSTVTIFAASGCKTGKFVGSYTRVDPQSDVFGDGLVIHQYIFQMTLNSDGTALQFWTGLQDFQINTGTGSPSIGSWTCRQDGKLVVTFLAASFAPVPAGPSNPLPDVSLALNLRTTLLFTVDDDNTLSRVQSRNRTYAASDDPTNPIGGTLRSLRTNVITYKRFVASDADLLLP